MDNKGHEGHDKGRYEGHDKGHRERHDRGYYEEDDEAFYSKPYLMEEQNEESDVDIHHHREHRNVHHEGHHEPHRKGHEKGHHEGHDKGYHEGHRESHSEGHDKGHHKGHHEPHHEGHDKGHREGHHEPHHEGHDKGHREGHHEPHRKGHHEPYKGHHEPHLHMEHIEGKGLSKGYDKAKRKVVIVMDKKGEQKGSYEGYPSPHKGYPNKGYPDKGYPNKGYPNKSYYEYPNQDENSNKRNYRIYDDTFPDLLDDPIELDPKEEIKRRRNHDDRSDDDEGNVDDDQRNVDDERDDDDERNDDGEKNYDKKQKLDLVSDNAYRFVKSKRDMLYELLLVQRALEGFLIEAKDIRRKTRLTELELLREFKLEEDKEERDLKLKLNLKPNEKIDYLEKVDFWYYLPHGELPHTEDLPERDLPDNEYATTTGEHVTTSTVKGGQKTSTAKGSSKGTTQKQHEKLMPPLMSAVEITKEVDDELKLQNYNDPKFNRKFRKKTEIEKLEYRIQNSALFGVDTIGPPDTFGVDTIGPPDTFGDAFGLDTIGPLLISDEMMEPA